MATAAASARRMTVFIRYSLCPSEAAAHAKRLYGSGRNTQTAPKA
jgi:hypothetical protein